MFPTDVLRLLRGFRYSRAARVGVISLGVGVSSALAAELTITPEPRPAFTGAIGDADFSSGSWRYFDPGFLVDHLPFRLTVAQSISYSDNVANLPASFTSVSGNNGFVRLPSRGDFFSDTTISAASRFYAGAQTFFFNGTFAPRQYFRDTALDATNFSINGGLDFIVADRCSGRLVGGINRSQTSLEQVAGFGVQEISSISFNETSRCKLNGSFAALFNSGVSQVENTGNEVAGPASLGLNRNNYNQYYVGGGLEYAVSSLDSLRGIATYTHRDFTARTNNLIPGLADSTDQEDLQFVYGRTFSAKLNGTVSGGVSLFSFPGSTQTSVEPSYAFGLNYRPTPKVVVSGTVSRSSGAPQNAVSNIQTSDTQSLSLSYIYSPKLSMTGIYSHSEFKNPGAVSTIGNIPVLFTNSSTNSASLVMSYQASPLLSASASYSYVDRSDTSRVGLDAVSNVFRVGLVYTR